MAVTHDRGDKSGARLFGHVVAGDGHDEAGGTAQPNRFACGTDEHGQAASESTRSKTHGLTHTFPTAQPTTTHTKMKTPRKTVTVELSQDSDTRDTHPIELHLDGNAEVAFTPSAAAALAANLLLAARQVDERDKGRHSNADVEREQILDAGRKMRGWLRDHANTSCVNEWDALMQKIRGT